MRYLLDTSAVLVHFLGEPRAAEVTAILADEGNEVLLAAPSITELGRRFRKLDMSSEAAAESLTSYRQLFGTIVAIDGAVAAVALEVADLTPERLPLVDSLIAGAARSRDACLVHRDRHMAGIPAAVVAQLDLDR